MLVGVGPVKAVNVPFARPDAGQIVTQVQTLPAVFSPEALPEIALPVASETALPETALPSTALRAEALPGQPEIIPREVWGAREPRCQWDGQDGRRVTHVVIHHTYEETGEPSIESAYEALQHIQNLHMDDNSWCDIGYSYLVDWFGNVYEGSRGTIEKPITSAHTAGFNYEGVGIALIGRYEDVPPTEAALEAAGRVAGWVLGYYGVPADVEVGLTVAGGNNRWARGTAVTVEAITGHRDLVRTECPGDATYARLDQVRAVAQEMTTQMQNAGQFDLGSTGATPIFTTGLPTGPLTAAEEPPPSQPEPANTPGYSGGFGQRISDADPETAALLTMQWWWLAAAVLVPALGTLWWFRFRRRGTN
jgi:hypothetical protein